jgi:hypothetical protein
MPEIACINRMASDIKVVDPSVGGKHRSERGRREKWQAELRSVWEGGVRWKQR